VQVWVGGVGAFGEDEPDAVVFGEFGAVAEHHVDSVVDVEGEAGEHAADFGVEGVESFDDEGVGDFGLGFGIWFRLGWARHVDKDASSKLRNQDSQSQC